MKKFFLFLILSFIISLFTTSCRVIKEVPIQTIEKIVYRDSLIYIHDSITIEVPYETVKEVLPEIDTSYLKTSLAESIAFVDTTTKQIYHTLTQKGELKTKIDTIIKIQYIDSIVEKEVPVEVEVVKFKRDALFWVLAAWAILCIVIASLKLFIFK